MMKKITYILSLTALLLVMSSCRSEDDFTESIFNTDIPVVDNTKTTAPFDQWLYDNFLKPYNVEIQYRFNFTASDMNFQLTPAEYGRSQLLAHFIRYLFYDVYTEYAGEVFMKRYGPRMFHFIGSTGYSPTTGTEVLGTASGGVKITLYNVNEIKPWSEDVVYTGDDVEVLNERIFHTMHHEFSHILHQTKSYPITFGQVTSGTYDPIDWQERDSTTTHQLGYMTHYASSASYEDFVETLSCTITDTDARWMNRIINACLPGLRQGDKERVSELIDSLEVNLTAPNAHWNNFTVYNESEYNEETGVYDDTDRLVLDVFRSSEQVVNKAKSAYVNKYRYTENKKFTSFKDFLAWVPYKSDEKLAGMNAILKKLDIATEWYTDRWGLHLFELRREVRNRQNAINAYLHSGNVVIYDAQ
jgi:substrate import-associated zinc metallohydrolase lipoprotein